MSRAVLRSKGQVTLPAEVREALHIREGDGVEFTVEADGRVILTGTTTIPADQAWFWTEGWQKGEREASEQIVRGVGSVYDSDDEFLASLDTD